MDGHLTGREQRLLDDVESHLRREDPALDRLLGARPTLLARLWHRPRILAALASALAALTAACALYAAADTPAAPAAATTAAASAFMLALVLRRLAALGAA
ncbi:DUF3040 domain-containing protein [Kitasatospora aureofaciens]|uniref:DUF3040 domain-containing protein n=2 Tax=Kitasatospora aureofaciens TaxID=1894 RepID=A0A1E7N9C7_KITAU|nr:DUF3040 domain-containing protein [Kitasatospora aureofaciens]OEV37244.1 hypothetical protein HS99_0005435 [Kitasatospora aureofaciens]GGU95930.1 hypothetical protein GCM10010502_57360 [Kitasatospora aureofaciens]